MDEINYILKGYYKADKGTNTFGFSAAKTQKAKLAIINGIIQGILSDNVINKDEEGFIMEWLSDYSNKYPKCLLSAAYRDKKGAIQNSQQKAHILKQILSLLPLPEDVLRECNEVMGLIRGVICDGELNNQEASFVKKIAEDKCHRWPLSNLRDAFDDLDLNAEGPSEKIKYLAEFLAGLVAGCMAPHKRGSPTTRLMVDDPDLESFSFLKNYFTLTGGFEMGSKEYVVDEIRLRGGLAHARYASFGGYLVLGSYSDVRWANDIYGRKVEYAKEGHQRIISEHFLKQAFKRFSAPKINNFKIRAP